MLLHQVGDTALDHQFALVKNRHAVADSFNFAEFVGGKEHRLALVFEALDDFAHLHAADGVEAAGGFVQNEEVGVVDERLRQADALCMPLE